MYLTKPRGSPALSQHRARLGTTAHRPEAVTPTAKTSERTVVEREGQRQQRPRLRGPGASNQPHAFLRLPLSSRYFRPPARAARPPPRAAAGGPEFQSLCRVTES